MRILIVNTSEQTGGAAVAAKRLMTALNNNGVKTKMLVRDKETDSLTVAGFKESWYAQLPFLWERWCIFLRMHFSRKHLFEVDIANTGTDITRLPEFKEADVIHLHWINQGMLSLKVIRKILDSGKPVVWTMHDIWPATGICHYARGCEQFHQQCGNCPLLPHGNANDLSARIWKRKAKMLEGHRISYVTCSRWLEEEARKSGLLKDQVVISIPNTINTHVFQPTDKQLARRALDLPTDKHVILFVSQRVTDKRKGLAYLVDAIDKMVEQHPERKENTVIAVLGGHSEEVANQLRLPVYPLGYVRDEQTIVNVYNAASVFVLPSLEDNLPNTIMEAMACGVPCVGFQVGGIPEMITHKENGYVAKTEDVQDLANGIHWVLEYEDGSLADAARKKVLTHYSQQRVAMRYAEVYQKALRTRAKRYE